MQLFHDNCSHRYEILYLRRAICTKNQDLGSLRVFFCVENMEKLILLMKKKKMH